MLPTLTFHLPSLEAAYLKQAAPTRARVAARFALFRLVVLTFTAARALLAVPGCCGREALLLLGAVSNCIPLVAASTSIDSRLARLAHWGTVGTEVLQATIGVINHRYMAPSRAGGQPAAALVYLPYGSTTLWLHCYAAFSMLPFNTVLMQQALVTMVLLAGSRSMCQESAGLRTGYAVLHTLLRHALQAVPAWRLPLVTSWTAAFFPMDLLRGSFICTASRAGSAVDARGSQSTVAAASHDGGVQADALAGLCFSYQLPVLLLGGFALSTWMVYRAERRCRLAWLDSLQHNHGRGGDATSTNSGGGGAAAWPAATDQDLALQRAVALEAVAPLPNDVDYWLQLALPCMLCMSFVVHAVM